MKSLLTLTLVLISAIVFSQKDSSWHELLKKPNPNYYEVKAAFDREWDGKDYEKGQGIKSFLRWENFMLKYMDPEGNYNASKNFEAFKNFQKQQAKIKQLAKTTSTSQWELLGPTNPPLPFGYNNNGIGRISDIAFHPTDTNVFYVGAATGGVWKTIDNGKTYQNLSSTWLSSIVKTLQLNPKSPNELWASNDDEIYHTTDGGATWATVSISDLFAPNGFHVNFEQNILLINHYYNASYSIDNGATWVDISTEKYNIDEFIIHPTNSLKVYGVSSNGLYTSNNGGKTFTLSTPAGVTFGSTNNRLATTPAEPNALYLLTVDQSDFEGVYKSTNMGSTFTKILSATDNTYYEGDNCGVCEYTAADNFGGQGWIHCSFGVSLVDPNRIFVGGVGIFHTSNGGTKWFYADGGNASTSPHVDHLNTRFQPITNLPFDCDDGGLYRGLRNRDEYNNFIWEDLNSGLSITQIYEIGVSRDGKRVLTGQQDNGAFMYNENNPDPWSFMVIGDGFGSGFDPVDENLMYTTTQRSSLKKSSNGGKSFSTIARSDDFNESSPFHTNFKTVSRYSGHIFMMLENLWRSEDEGETWTNLTETIEKDLRFADYSIQQSNKNVITIYDSQFIFLSTDGGATWKEINRPLNQWGSPSFIYELALHSRDTNTLWINTSTSFFETTDGGVNWTENTNWPEISVNEMVHIDGSNNHLLIATTNGVIEKQDGSNDFILLGNNLPAVSCTDLEINYCTSELFLATYGRGVWKIDLNLPSSACCPDLPKVNYDKPYLCDSPITATVDNATSATINWSKDGNPIANNSNQLQINNSGFYEVYLTENSCESIHKGDQITSMLPSFESNSCYEFELDLTSNIIFENNPAIPGLTEKTISGCPQHGTKALGSSLTHSFHPAGDTASFLIKQLDLSLVTSPKLGYSVSTEMENSGNMGTFLRVLISEDCGKTFTPIFTHTKEDIGNINIPFGFTNTPSACNQWNDYELDLSNYEGKKVLVKFEVFALAEYLEYNTYYGGNIFIDNICLNGEIFVGLFDNIQGSKINYYPNPVLNTVQFESSENITKIELLNSKGILLQSFSNGNEIDLEPYHSGTYLIKVITNDYTESLKVIKQ